MTASSGVLVLAFWLNGFVRRCLVVMKSLLEISLGFEVTGRFLL